MLRIKIHHGLGIGCVLQLLLVVQLRLDPLLINHLLVIVLQLSLPHPLFLLLLLLSYLQLLIPYLPKFLKLLLLLLLIVPLCLLPRDLLLPRSLYSLLHLPLLLLLLIEQMQSFLLSLHHLLVQNLVIFILYIHKHLCLPLNQLLSSILLLFELLFLFVPSQLVHCILLLCILLSLSIQLLLSLQLSDLLLLHVDVGLFEGSSNIHLLLSPLNLSLMLFDQLFLYLSFNQFSLQLLFLHPLDNVDLEISVLVLDVLGILHLLLVFFHQFVSQVLVILIHLLQLLFFPLVLYFLVHFSLSLLQLLLIVSFLQDVAHKHLRVESLHLVAFIMSLELHVINNV